MQKNAQLNKVQYSIVRSLFLKDGQRFSELNEDSISNDHFSYHIRRLIGDDFILKDESGTYHLTTRGRTLAILLDADDTIYINQGFVACRVVLTREVDGQKQYLLQERTKVPYKGRFAEPGGKILWGELVLSSAHRNMLEQTGLDCDLEMKGQVHLHDEFEGEIVQDKFFYVIKATNPKGKLLESGPSGINHWVDIEDPDIASKLLGGVETIHKIAESDEYQFIEQKHQYDKY